MSHSELAIAGLYDHEHEVVRENHRRIPDWGGDDVFASAPRRRRFEHREDLHDRAPHLRMRDTHEQPLPRRRRVEDWGVGDEAWGPAPAAERDTVLEPEPLTPAPALAVVEDEAPPAIDDRYLEQPQVAANGRRTVTITGHPGATARRQRPLDAAPRRAPRTWDERLTHRPERIAMWAFALGILLIVIAIASS